MKKRFIFTFKVSEAMARQDPRTTAALIQSQKDEVERMIVTHGPRGGAYVLQGPWEPWQSGITGDDWMRQMFTYATARQGRYVRPSK